MVKKDTERLWEQIFAYIEDGCVIPIIGPELLLHDIDGKTRFLYSYLAEQLAKRLQISSEPEDTLNAVVCRYLSQGGEREDIYPELKQAMPPLSQVKLPETLVKLAEIRPFKLFVTTSFDPLLVHALNQVRYGGLEKTQVLEFSLGSNNDLPVGLKDLDRATVFHLFGKLTSVPEYAVTDEDVLEFMHALQARTSCPQLLFDVLIKLNLIVIGCPLPDWLGRFFVRSIGKKERLLIPSGKTDFLVGNQLHNDKDLAEFLQYYSRRTTIFPMTSIEFVNELHLRWTNLHPEPLPDTIPPPDPIPAPEPMHRGAVFLSYASEDRSAVISIRDALEQAGIDVWFDRNPEALRIGENFENKIKANIDHCSLFIPIISQHTLTPKPRFFRIEWNYAQDVAARYADNWRFIIPVAIDDTPSNSTAVPEKFRKLHWERMQGGQTHVEFVEEIRLLYREYQKTLAESA